MRHFIAFLFLSVLGACGAKDEEILRDPYALMEATPISSVQQPVKWEQPMNASILNESPPNSNRRLRKFPKKLPEQPTEWATDVLLDPYCDLSLESFAVAKGHVIRHDCEVVRALGYMDLDDDYFEQDVLFTWEADDPSDFDIGCESYGSHNFCWPIGKKDLFDTENGAEPKTPVTVCGENDCPDFGESSCSHLVCTWFGVTSVVNLEGSWKLAWDHDDGPEPIYDLTQEGRKLSSPGEQLKKGWVKNNTVSFERNDVRFEGVIFADRQTIVGVATELLTLTPAGTWKATRQF